MQQNKTQIAKIILDGLKNHYKFKTYGELASFLGVPQSTLGSWKARGSIDEDLIYAKCVGINADWLKTGQGEMFKGEGGAAKDKKSPPPLDDDLLAKALKMVESLTKDVQVDQDQKAALVGNAYKEYYKDKYDGEEDD